MIFVKLILAFITGLIAWTFAEYNGHKYLLHGSHEQLPESKKFYIDPTEA